MVRSFFWRKLLARSGFARFIPSVCRSLGGGEDFLRYYSDCALAVPIDELRDPALLPDIGTPNSINLALGSPRIDLLFGLGRAVNDRRPDSAWGDIELRSEIGIKLHLDHGVEYDSTDEVLIAHGASGAYAAVLDAFVNVGDPVVLFDPTSPIFPIGLKHRRARLRWVPTWSDEGRVRFAMDVFAKTMRGAKLLVLADPVNPTGCVFAPEDLEQIAFWAGKYDVLVFQDVSFDRWRAEPAKARLASLPHCEERILTCGSFAKSHGLTAARVGWLAGHRHLVKPCAAASVLSAPFVPSICQQAALQAMRNCEAVLSELATDFNTRRGYVLEQLNAMGLQPWSASAGFFCWVPVLNGEGGHTFAQRLLSDSGVLVNPGHVFGPSGTTFVRVSFATDEGRLREGLNRIVACGVARARYAASAGVITSTSEAPAPRTPIAA
ncbi:MAG TPA: pyridoxal phosphate-dependent aminotransferase [Gemmataceae bacterium]|nr:pyridoxal phosphate-dependent aminotransferase [Gemmataceae bacterium]